VRTLFDPVQALRILDRHRVRYVVIGGFAADLLGAPLSTDDLDICCQRSVVNMTRLGAALRELEAQPRIGRLGEKPPPDLDPTTLAASEGFSFDTVAGRVDVRGTPHGTGGYTDLSAKAQLLDIDGISVRVVALGDLLRMKRAGFRIEDRMHLEVLAALQEMLEQTSRE
jgi:hypothetical protein